MLCQKQRHLAHPSHFEKDYITMSQMHDGNAQPNAQPPDEHDAHDLERLLVEGVSLHQAHIQRQDKLGATPLTSTHDEDEEDESLPDNDVQGAYGLFAE